jgi:hypothetical protein
MAVHNLYIEYYTKFYLILFIIHIIIIYLPTINDKCVFSIEYIYSKNFPTKTNEHFLD